MQILNKTEFKRKFVYTWYLYVVGIVVSFFCWFWSFQAFHQPSDHQRLTLFFGAQVKDVSFRKEIQAKYDEKDLRLIEINGCDKNSSIYANKLNIFLSNADLLILPEDTIDEFAKTELAKELMDNYFCELDETTKNKYLQNSNSYYSLTSDGQDYDYGVLIRAKNGESWLDEFVNFENEFNYYMLVPRASVNTGILYSEENEPYTNALVAMQYLIGGVE